EIKPVVKQKKVPKVSEARQLKADLEKPQVRPAGVKGDLATQALAASALRPEFAWHVSARIIYPEPGKHIWLNDQSEEAQSVVRGGIGKLKTSLIMVETYPSILSRTRSGKGYLIASADEIPDAIHIKECLMTDPKYAALLADLLIDRVNILRGGVKKIAVNVAPGFYKLSGLNAQQTKVAVEELLKDHRYIFPSEPLTARYINRLKVDSPFLHPAMVAVIKQGVFTGQFKAKNQHLFTSTYEKRPKNLELPDAMVSLAATAIYAALVEYCLTGEQQSINFTEGAYEDTYRNHMKTLSDTRAMAAVPIHQLLHRLYNEVTESKAAQPSTGSSAILINVVDVPDSD
ncbi:hypothetical protein DFH09DRAFT_1338427, partial [Mycena vulgaris]